MNWREEFREYGRNFFTNWSDSGLPLWRRSGVLVRNRARSLINGGCCGNHGQPGC